MINIPPEQPDVKLIAAAAGRRFAPAWLRRYILERDKYSCNYCHCKLTYQTANIDHKIPWPEGLTIPENLVASCKDCNRRKGRRRKPTTNKSDRRFLRIQQGLSPNAPKGVSWRQGMR